MISFTLISKAYDRIEKKKKEKKYNNITVLDDMLLIICNLQIKFKNLRQL